MFAFFQGVDLTQIRTNILAAYVSAGRSSEVAGVMQKMGMTSKLSCEAAFNSACAKIALGDLSKAKDELHLALRLGKESLFEDDYTEAEVEEELLPITAQLGYVAALEVRLLSLN